MNKKLLEAAQNTGTFLKTELNRVQKEAGRISNVRGLGTFIGFDADDSAKVLRWLNNNGINIHSTGDHSIGIRPSVTLKPRHCKNIRDELFHYSPHAEF